MKITKEQLQALIGHCSGICFDATYYMNLGICDEEGFQIQDLGGSQEYVKFDDILKRDDVDFYEEVRVDIDKFFKNKLVKK